MHEIVNWFADENAARVLGAEERIAIRGGTVADVT